MSYKNIYQLYHLNHSSYIGLIVKKYTWEKIVAQIIRIDDVEEGYKIKGRSPYYGNPTVWAKYYQISRFWAGNPIFEYFDEGLLYNSGNYSWEIIQFVIKHDFNKLNNTNENL